MALLEVEDLNTYFRSKNGIVKAVQGVTYSIEEGKTLGIMGESGSGKSVSAMSILKLLPKQGYIHSGKITLDGEDITKWNVKKMNRIRGKKISVIFQEPMTSLNPVITIEHQIMEVYQIHEKCKKEEARKRAYEMLKKVQIANPIEVAKGYPHQLSGGMRQRIMIAMAFACHPKILIADEPTTALDVTTQAQVLKLMNELKEKYQMSILFISHDFGVIRQIADEVAVMYAGQVVERVVAKDLYKKDALIHPYTKGLMEAVPTLTTNRKERLMTIPGCVPSPMEEIKGCRFALRCKYCEDICNKEMPDLIKVGVKHWIRCHRAKKFDCKSEKNEEVKR